jgi:dTDP-4-dehydrorhamnose reductase
MKALVLGVNGMAGHTIAIYLSQKGVDVIGFARKESKFCKTIIGDATNFDKLRQIIQSGDFNFIVNAVGVLNEEAERNKSNAVLINSYLPHFLVEICKESKTKIIHLSTDCVFSGDRGRYIENDFHDGSTYYDKSKSLGEINNNKDLTFRNSIIGPDLKINGIGLFNWFMKQNGQIYGYKNVLWSGVTTLTLAKAILVAVNKDLTGVYHLVNNLQINKYELLTLFKTHMKKNNIKILPLSQPQSNKTLIRTRDDFLFEVPSYDEMVKEMCMWINDNKKIYKQYFSK